MIHLQKEIDHLKKLLLSLSAEVEEEVILAVRSLEQRDTALAERVIALDKEIDEREVALEEECLKILALHQPVAIDLRFIIAVLKINNDLERIGDLAVNIAETTLDLAERDAIALPEHLATMAAKTKQMLHDALDALLRLDAAEARRVLEADDEVDALHRQTFDIVEPWIKEHPERVRDYIRLLSASRNLERIADHATNIAEDVIYLVEGQIVRHQSRWGSPQG